MHLHQVEAEGVVVPGPEVVQPAAAQRRHGGGMCVHGVAEATDELGEHFERKGPRHVRAAVALPLLDDEVRLVHEFVADHLRGQVGALATRTVAAHDRHQQALDERRAPGLRVQHARASLRQPRLEQIARDRIGNRFAHAFEHPPVIEKHQIDPHPDRACCLERRVKVCEQMRIGTERQTAIVVDDARAPVTEDEPPRHPEPQPRHPLEIARHRLPARRDAKMRPPHVGAEIQTVVDRASVG